MYCLALFHSDFSGAGLIICNWIWSIILYIRNIKCIIIINLILPNVLALHLFFIYVLFVKNCTQYTMQYILVWCIYDLLGKIDQCLNLLETFQLTKNQIKLIRNFKIKRICLTFLFVDDIIEFLTWYKLYILNTKV